MSKKSSAILLTLTTILLFAGFASKNRHESKGRFPANQELSLLETYNEKTEDRLGKIPNLVPESEKGKSLMDVYNSDSSGLTCITKNKESDLELRISKLMADKEAIVLELEELQGQKKKKTKVVSTESSTNDLTVTLLEQISSLLITQQKQLELMNQMFTMFQSNQTQNNNGPMTFAGIDFIGIGLQKATVGLSQNPYAEVQPVVTQSPYSLNQPVQAQMFQNNGFDFGPEMTRIQL